MDTYLAPEPPDSDDTVDPYGPDSGLAALAAFCERSEIPLPPLPEAFIPLLTQTGETVFSSRDDLVTLTDIDTLIEEAASGDGVPFMAVSHEGYGANSWYFTYIVSLPSVAMFAAIPFGGVYRDAESDRALIEAIFDQAAPLLAQALGYEGTRSFVVTYRGFGKASWCEIGGAWQIDPDALLTVTAKLTA